MKHLYSLFILLFLYTQTSATIHEITAQNFSYTPENITINVGDTIIWINNGGNHNVNGNTNTITEQPFNNPESFFSNPTNVVGATIYTHVFNIAGEYNYDCSIGLHAQNGMIGTINVLPQLPASVFEIIEQSDAHDTLEFAILEAGLDEALSGDGTFTVFAPTDDAFAQINSAYFQTILGNDQLLTSVLTHHVHAEDVLLSTDLFDNQMITTLNNSDLTITQVNDSTFKVDDAMIIITDLEAQNGVVHVIDMVLTPPIPETTVFDLIELSDIHTTLETAINEAGLAETLSGDGPFTVFAPTDEAFNNLPEGTLDNLLDDIPTLTQLLTHHVHGGELLSENISDGLEISTLNNDNLTASNDGTTIMIDGATVITADITQAVNGVIHVINAVLTLEEEPTSIEMLNLTENHSYLYTLNLLGEKVDRNSDEKILIDIFSNGKIIKRLNTNIK